MRNDIQCLRAFSIFFVFLYHLWPNVFENGYLGVDIFFVISGFLMAQNLMRKRVECVKDFLEFYYRRFKRILPLYYLVLFLITVGMHFMLMQIWMGTNYRYSLASFFLVTNQLIIHDSSDYFKEFMTDGTSFNCFIHFWSLGVELQFYLLVPFIFYGLYFLKSDLLKLVATILTTLIGGTAFLLINQQFAFNFMLLRLWQFSAGFSAQLFTKINLHEYSSSLKPNKMFNLFGISQNDVINICLAILALCILPLKLNTFFARPIVTFIAACLLSFDSNQNLLMNSDYLSYIGDLSYIIYLIHWPIIVMFNLGTIKSYLMCIVMIIMLSVGLHHFFEKTYLTFNKKKLIPLLLFLILLNAYLQTSIRRHEFWKNTMPNEVQEIVNQNEAELPFVWDVKGYGKLCDSVNLNYTVENLMGYCKHTKGNGTLKIMIIGNSYALNFMEAMRVEFNSNYSTFEVISIGENYLIHSDTDASRKSQETSKNIIKEVRPDILYIFSRYSNSLKSPINNIKEDEFITEMNTNIAFLEIYTKYIFIMGAHPLYPINFMNFFIQTASTRRHEIEKLHLVKKDADEEMRNIRRRFKSIKCKKCQVFEVGPIFAEADKYLTFDRDTMYSYVDNTIHLTSAGLEVAKPILRNLSQMAFERV